MLDFRPRKDGAHGRFSLDPADHVRAKAPMSRRRVWHLISLMVVMLVTGGMFYKFLSGLRTAITPATDQLKHEVMAPAMRRPSLEGLGAFPMSSAIREQEGNAAELIKTGTAPLWIDQPDASTLAWIGATFRRDQSDPPLPQRVTGNDLALGHVHAGSCVLFSGMLEDSRTASEPGADPGWQRMLVRLDANQYAEVLAPASSNNLPVGNVVQAVGRYLGPAVLPGSSADGHPAATVKLPLIAARSISQAAARVAEENPWQMHGAWQLPDDLYTSIDDNLLILETKPYYYTLGQVKLDVTSPDAQAPAADANRHASEIHQTPSAFRGKRFTVHGHVFSAWEDAEVAQDQPFGVDRVVRVIMWSEDWGLYDQQDSSGKVTTSNKLVLRAFEIAAIGHQALPQPGDIISATGRFLRLRSMEVKPDPRRDASSQYQRQSDKAFTFLFVTDGFTVLPPQAQYDWTLVSIITIVVSVAFAALLLVLARRESRKQELVFESVRRLRDTRGRLHARLRTGQGPEAAASDAPAAAPPAIDASAADAPPSPAPPSPAPPSPAPPGSTPTG